MAQDIKYFEGDLIIMDGDLLVEEDDDTRTGHSGHVESIVMDSHGQWYQHPKVGVAVRNEINGPVNPALKIDINRQLKADNFKINETNVIFVDGKLQVTIDANK